MRRSTTTVLALGLTWLALPAVPAHACTLPAPTFDVSREVVVAGDPLDVSGEAVGARCPGGIPVPPSETPTETPTEAPSETATGTPSESATETVSPTATRARR